MAYPMVVVAAALTLMVRPSIVSGDVRWLDIALIAYLAFVAVQLIPLPAPLRLGLSPASRIVDLRLRLDAPAVPLADTAHPLTVDTSGTMQSLALAIAAVLTFWCARSLFARGGVRLGARAIAALGLAVAAFGIAQHATAPRALYWLRTMKTATPFGPYMNRSDFAMFIVMALPLTAGYLLARLHLHQRNRGNASAFDAFDDVAMFLTVSMGLMAAALVVGLSRSGLVGAAASALALWTLSQHRMQRQGRVWLLGGIAAVAVIGLAFANAAAVATRIQDTVSRTTLGRVAIWRATLLIVRDFWLTGTGAGAYERAMMVYQPAPHETYFNHAHNEYLQLVTEGGLWLMIPGAAAAVAAIAGIRRRLHVDRTPIYWVRAGAVSGLAGVAVQSLWETGLRRPANTLLFAMLMAFALHSAAQPARRTAQDSVDVSDR